MPAPLQLLRAPPRLLHAPSTCQFASWAHDRPLLSTHRAVKEELGSALTSPASVSTIAVLEDSYCSSERVEEAHSYPGIQCLYRVHHAAVRIDDLPADDFDTWEPREGGRLVTRWQWRDVEA